MPRNQNRAGSLFIRTPERGLSAAVAEEHTHPPRGTLAIRPTRDTSKAANENSGLAVRSATTMRWPSSRPKETRGLARIFGRVLRYTCKCWRNPIREHTNWRYEQKYALAAPSCGFQAGRAPEAQSARSQACYKRKENGITQKPAGASPRMPFPAISTILQP